MLKPGKRQLRDITDQELQVIVEMSHHYGCKDFWGNPVITDIDRIEEEKADLLAQLAESAEVNDIITKIADKIGEAEEQEAIIARLDKVKKYINEDIEVEDEGKQE